MARKPNTPLRRGWTTGACATAATKAALTGLLTGEFPDPVSITLPKGQQPAFALATERLDTDTALAGIVKDAGDDPDVTHRALICAKVSRADDGEGVVFRAGAGVGTVTLPGLPVPVGEPAINPVPRRMMRAVVEEVSAAAGVGPDVIVEISVADGERLAQQTWKSETGNRRRDFHSRHHRHRDSLFLLGLDPLHSSRHRRRNRGRLHARCRLHRLDLRTRGPDPLRPARYRDAGHGGLRGWPAQVPAPPSGAAADHRWGLREAVQACDGDTWTCTPGAARSTWRAWPRGCGDLGGTPALAAETESANTANQVLQIAGASGLPLATRVAREARTRALAMLDGRTQIEVVVFDRQGELAGRSEGY